MSTRTNHILNHILNNLAHTIRQHPFATSYIFSTGTLLGFALGAWLA